MAELLQGETNTDNLLADSFLSLLPFCPFLVSMSAHTGASMMGGSLFLLMILAPPPLLYVSWFCYQHYRTCSLVFISSPKVLITSLTLSCLYLFTVISVGFVEGEEMNTSLQQAFINYSL